MNTELVDAPIIIIFLCYLKAKEWLSFLKKTYYINVFICPIDIK